MEQKLNYDTFADDLEQEQANWKMILENKRKNNCSNLLTPNILFNSNCKREESFTKKELKTIILIADKIINGIRNRVNIKLSINEMESLVNILNRNGKTLTFFDVNDKIDRVLLYGEGIIFFIDDYNKELELAKKKNELEQKRKIEMNKKKNKVLKHITKYLNNLENISTYNLDEKYLPKYSNPNFIEITEYLLVYLNRKEELNDKYDLLLKYYKNYFNSKYYTKDKMEERKNQYYSYVLNVPYEEFDDEFIPMYDNPEFLYIMRFILDNIKDKKEYMDKYGLLLHHYGIYLNRVYKDSDLNEKEFVK